MFKKRLNRALALTVTATLVMAVAALADTVVGDGDTATLGVQDPVSLGTVDPGAVLNPAVRFTLNCTGKNHPDAGQTVDFTFALAQSTIPAGGSLSATDGAIGPIPAAWPDDTAGGGSTNCSDPAESLASGGAGGAGSDSAVTITAPVTPGPYTYIVRWNFGVSPAGSNDANAIVGSNETVTYTLTVAAPAGDSSDPTNAAISIRDGAAWTNDENVTVDISADDNVGVAEYFLAESQLDLDSATGTPVSPAEPAFSRDNVAFALTGADAASKSVWLRVCDAADNCAENSDEIGLDRVDPTSVVDGFDNGAIYYLGDTLPTPSCDDDDDLSGVASGGGGTLSGPTGTGPSNPNHVGSFIYSCNGAVDNAGNVQTVADTKTFWVYYAGVSGILQPINYDNTSLFSRGKAVPVKFRLAGDESTGFDFSSWSLQRVQVTCGVFDADDAVLESLVENPSNGFRYDSTADQYIYNANFKDQAAGTCWKVRVTLDSGQVLNSAVFKLQK
jgi:hypothetical protein